MIHLGILAVLLAGFAGCTTPVGCGIITRIRLMEQWGGDYKSAIVQMDNGPKIQVNVDVVYEVEDRVCIRETVDGVRYVGLVEGKP